MSRVPVTHEEMSSYQTLRAAMAAPSGAAMRHQHALAPTQVFSEYVAGDKRPSEWAANPDRAESSESDDESEMCAAASKAASSVRTNHEGKPSVIVFPRKRGGSSSEDGVIELSVDSLRPLFEMRQADAAKNLGIAASTLKHVCRQLAIGRWPWRSQKSSRTRPPAGGAPGTSNSPQTQPSFAQMQGSFPITQPSFAQMQPSFSQTQPSFNQSQSSFAQTQPSFAQSQTFFSTQSKPSIAQRQSSFTAQTQPSFNQSHPSQMQTSFVQTQSSFAQGQPSILKTQQMPVAAAFFSQKQPCLDSAKCVSAQSRMPGFTECVSTSVTMPLMSLPNMALVSGQSQKRLAIVLEEKRKRMMPGQGLHVVGKAGAYESDDDNSGSNDDLPSTKAGMHPTGHGIWMKLDKSRSSLLDEALDLI